jgi:hypothetical protein
LDPVAKTLEAVDTRLSELEEEQAELKEFQEKDRDRRSLEYAIYSKELEEIGTTLDNVSLFGLPFVRVILADTLTCALCMDRWKGRELRT